MTAKNRNDEKEFSGLRELDRIVMQLSEAYGHRGAPQKRGPIPKPQSGNVIYKDEWSPAESGRETDEKSQLDEDFDQYEHDNHDADDEDGLFMETEFTDDNQPEASDDTGPLSENELAFVERTVRWLDRRENKDIILDQIWRRLLPQVEESQDAEEGNAPNDETGADDPDRDGEPAED